MSVPFSILEGDLRQTAVWDRGYSTWSAAFADPRSHFSGSTPFFSRKHP